MEPRVFAYMLALVALVAVPVMCLLSVVAAHLPTVVPYVAH